MARTIEDLVAGFTAGRVSDDEMAQWLREVYEHGLSDEDTCALAFAMASSGDRIDWSDANARVVDKHSTGGVGDDVSLIAVPLAAACGARVAKLAGGALGHTGGTIDKLRCVPGLKTDLPVDDFKRQVLSVGCAIASASDRLAPADKKIYALRNATGTVESIPLVAASVMSKKIASGAAAVVVDVKFGHAAFAKTPADARRLASLIRQIGDRAGMQTTTHITAMDEPLADSVGDALELDEALAVLECRHASESLRDVALTIAASMVRAGGGHADRTKLEHLLADGSALKRMHAMIAAQGGMLREFPRPAQPLRVVTAPRSGYVASVDARRLGEVIARAKVGLPAAEAAAAGVRLLRRRGQAVLEDQPLFASWIGDASSDKEALTAFAFSRLNPPPALALAPAAPR